MEKKSKNHNKSIEETNENLLSQDDQFQHSRDGIKGDEDDDYGSDSGTNSEIDEEMKQESPTDHSGIVNPNFKPKKSFIFFMKKFYNKFNNEEEESSESSDEGSVYVPVKKANTHYIKNRAQLNQLQRPESSGELFEVKYEYYQAQLSQNAPDHININSQPDLQLSDPDVTSQISRFNKSIQDIDHLNNNSLDINKYKLNK